MFTGIVQGIRKITAVEDLEGRRRLRIQLEELAEKLQQGASCLLYTSDAADDMQCVDLGGRRIIKKR